MRWAKLHFCSVVFLSKKELIWRESDLSELTEIWRQCQDQSWVFWVLVKFLVYGTILYRLIMKRKLLFNTSAAFLIFSQVLLNLNHNCLKFFLKSKILRIYFLTFFSSRLLENSKLELLVYIQLRSDTTKSSGRIS